MQRSPKWLYIRLAAVVAGGFTGFSITSADTIARSNVDSILRSAICTPVYCWHPSPKSFFRSHLGEAVLVFVAFYFKAAPAVLPLGSISFLCRWSCRLRTVALAWSTGRASCCVAFGHRRWIVSGNSSMHACLQSETQGLTNRSSQPLAAAMLRFTL
jgi:hypothetical protein